MRAQGLDYQMKAQTMPKGTIWAVEIEEVVVDGVGIDGS